jgi:pSer/pThr/pTyr-binding forkhead associated (FHA) protein
MASLRQSEAPTFNLIGDRVTIGRDPVNDLVLPDDSKVSRSHAELSRRDGQWILVDLESRNGTFVNGRRVGRHPLRDGDRIEFGGTVLTFGSQQDANATEVASVDCAPTVGLSEREHQILDLVAQGLTDRDIGEQLFISISTVRSHLDRIKEKTGLRRRAELTRYALRTDIG